MGRVFLTSDTHFDHVRVARLRGFDTPAAHDAEVIANWNATVGPDDVVWHLGDVGMGRTERFFPQVRQLNGTIHLITGNHDAPWPGSRHSHTVQRAWLEVFETVQPFARRRIDGRNVLLCHLPYQGDHLGGEERHEQYRLRDEGLPLLCGHVHEAWRESRTDRGTFQLNVGLDQWDLTPVALETVAAVLAEQEPVSAADRRG